MKLLLFILIFLQFTAHAQDRQTWWMLNNAKTYQPTDADALAYVDSVALTDYISNARRIAIDTLVIKLKRGSFWTTFAYAYYPFPVRTASGNKWNLFNPHNTDAAFRLTFTGSPTFDDTGMHLNGTSQYANTFLTPSTTLTLSNISFGFYSETQSTSGTQIWGAFDGSNNIVQVNMTTANVVIGNLVAATYTAGTTTGLIMGSRTATNALAAYLNTTSVASSVSNTSTLPAYPIFLGARNNSGTAQFFSSHTCAFAFITKGMNSTQQAAFYAIIQDYETRLNRNK